MKKNRYIITSLLLIIFTGLFTWIILNFKNSLTIKFVVLSKNIFIKIDDILFCFLIFVILLLIFLSFYLIWKICHIKQDKIIGEKELYNKCYMLDVEKELFNAYMNPEYFDRALQKIANFLTAEIAFFWSSDCESDIKYRIYSNGDREILKKDNNIWILFEKLFLVLKQRKSILSYDMTLFSKEVPEIKNFNIYNLMVIPITGLNDESTIILGVFNMECIWKDVKYLKQISWSFFTAVNHYVDYQNLKKMSQLDSLTGLMNRNSYHIAIDTIKPDDYLSIACIYIDANGLHEINNHLGHQAGDKMLKTIANTLLHTFLHSDIYRIGGDEFVILCKNHELQDIYYKAEIVKQNLESKGYGLSIGIEWRNKNLNMKNIISMAELSMQKNKRQYYQENGKERQMRTLDQKLEQILLEKQDADAFLAVIAPEFKGVYFVDLGNDTIRHLYIPPYFEEILKESDDMFSKALLIYAYRIAKPEYFHLFEKFCDYNYLENQLDNNITPEFLYQKKDNTWLKLKILKFKNYTKKCRETLWIFSNKDN